MSQRMIYQTEETRNRIMDVSEQLFIANGFADTQMKDIAAAVGVSRNTLYRYYQDRYDLGFAILVEILKRNMKTVARILNDIEQGAFPSVREGIRRLILANCTEETAGNERFIAEFDAYYSGSRIPHEFRERLLQELPDNNMKRLVSLFKAGQKEGSIRKDIDPRHLSVTVFNAVPVFYRRMLLRQEALIEVDPETIPRLTPIMVELLFDGLKPRED